MAPLQIEQLPEQWRECRWHQNGNLFASILESHLPEVQGIIANLQTRLSAQEWRTDHWHNIAVKADAARDAALQEHALMMQDANSTVETYRARVNVLVRERAAARRTLIALQKVAREVVDSLPEGALAIFSLSKWIKKLAARLPAVEGQKP